MRNLFSEPIICDEHEIEILKDTDLELNFWSGFYTRDFQPLESLKPRLKAGDMVSVNTIHRQHDSLTTRFLQ